MVAGLLAVPIVFLSASAVSQPHWDWDTSFFGRLIALPLLAVVPCVCIAAAFSTRISLGWRFALAAVVLAVFIGIVAASYILGIIFFGAPFH